MIKKSFIVFLVCMVVYSIFVSYATKGENKWFGAQNMWQENIIRMQDYVYSDAVYPNVLLGTSLTMNVAISQQDLEVFNLAAGGGDPFIGLEIIKRSGRFPKRIFVESNFVLTKKVHDETYLGTLYRPGLYELRKWVPALKEQFQPVNLVGQGMLNAIKKIVEKDKTGKAELKNKPGAARPKATAAHPKYNMSDFPADRIAIEKNILLLKEYVGYFKRKNVEIVFFEMPRDCNVQSNYLLVYSRNTIHSFAQENGLKEIPLPSCADYSSYDGLHLDESSLLKYTDFFLVHVKRI